MKKLFIESVGIILTAVLLGLLTNMINPAGIPIIGDWSEQPAQENAGEITVINVEQAYKIWQSKDAVFIDARTPSDFAIDHIPGAINLPRGNTSEYFTAIQTTIKPDTKLVVYCSSKDCEDSSVIANFLKNNEYTSIYLYEDGIIAWDMHNFPLEQ